MNDCRNCWHFHEDKDTGGDWCDSDQEPEDRDTEECLGFTEKMTKAEYKASERW